jgi:hypothetical protein
MGGYIRGRLTPRKLAAAPRWRSATFRKFQDISAAGEPKRCRGPIPSGRGEAGWRAFSQEKAMLDDPTGNYHHPRHNRQTTDDLHPRVYASLIGLAVWFLAAIWIFFYHGGYTDVIFVVVTGLVAVMIAIPSLIWLTWRKAGGQTEAPPGNTFRDWASGEFKTGSGQLSGLEAAAQILLPIAGVAVGMTLFGLALYATNAIV